MMDFPWRRFDLMASTGRGRRRPKATTHTKAFSRALWPSGPWTPRHPKPICRLTSDQRLANRPTTTLLKSAAGSGRRHPLCGGDRWQRFHFPMEHRQLQHGHTLPFAELRHQQAASIREFDCIMVAMWNIPLDRGEFSDAAMDGLGPYPAVVVLDIVCERQLGPREYADRHAGFGFGGEASGRRTGKLRRHQRLPDLGRAARQSVQTIVTHRIAPRSR